MIKSIRPFIVVLALACLGLMCLLLHKDSATAAPMPTAAPALQGMLTYHTDIASTGCYSNEVKLSPQTVRFGLFGRLFTTPVDGQVYAQPLVAAGVNIGKGVNTKPGAEGVHDAVYVATQKDALYAIDGGASGGQILWHRDFLDLQNAGGNQNNLQNATVITTLGTGEVRSGDINPSIGITGTPTIDGTTGILYLVVKTKETIGGTIHYIQRLHAISCADGTDRIAPFSIGDTVDPNDNTTPIYVFGSGDGSVMDTHYGTGKKVVEFNALREHHRGALNLVNGTLYVEWASHSDGSPYHGWVVCWDVSHIATTGFKISGVLNVSPNSGASGIWQSGGWLAFEPDGSAFYFETGNGTGGPPTLNADGFPSNGAYNEALVKVVADPTTTVAKQNINGWGLKVADYFIPYNVVQLDHADADFGSGGAVLLPDAAGIPGHPHLIIGGGKDGKLFVFDRDHLGHYDPAGDHVLNAAPGPNPTPEKMVTGLLSTPAWFNGKLYATSGFGGPLYAFRLEQSGALTLTSQTTANNGQMGHLPGGPSVSSNGVTNGIVWQLGYGKLYAYDANTMATELWDSAQRQKDADKFGETVKFTVPTIYNGRVYGGTGNSLVAYGIIQQPTAVPVAPVLTATPMWSSSINLTWTDASKFPNLSGGYSIEQSTDGVRFTAIPAAGERGEGKITVPGGATSLAVGKLTKLTKYYFRIRGSNALGDSPFSNVASVTTNNKTPSINFADGFADAGNSLKVNGSAAINKKNLRITTGGNEAGSAYFAEPVDITAFSSHFTFKLNKGDSANGFAFVLQNTGVTALGRPGAGLGYGASTAGGQGGIDKSVAIKFDLFNSNGEGPSSTGLYINGAAPTDVGSVDLRTAEINLHSGDTFDVTIQYNGAKLNVTIKDTVTGKSDTHAYPVDIQKTVGGNVAYAGFTGGTSRQGKVTTEILQWTMAATAVATISPNAPSGLGAVPASAVSVSLNWTSNAPNQVGYHLDRATDAAFTKDLVVVNVPDQPDMFTDTTAGLTPGSTFYYRLRAYNALGDSDNSNVAQVTIPRVPPAATHETVDSATATEIDITWQDNAGELTDGYKIMRAVNHGTTFTQVVNLPPTSRTAPSPYSWTDSDVTPGTYYEYHIVPYNIAGDADVVGVHATTPAK